MTDKPKKDPLKEASAEEVVSLALNEQGFLFQQRILEEISRPDIGNWYPSVVEYPVAFGLPGTFDTRIDMVLRRRASLDDPWHLVVECKRANRDYKRWIFFDELPRLIGLSSASIFYHRAELNRSWSPSEQELPPLTQRIESVPGQGRCPIYNFYVESRINRPNSGGNIASATEAIEESLRQVCTGLVGLTGDLHKMKQLRFNLLPLVVTTAEISSADFASNDISLNRGIIDAANLRLTPRPWVAVNYRIDESLLRFAHLTTRASTLEESIRAKYTRTVFVVQAEHLTEFLSWINEWIAS